MFCCRPLAAGEVELTGGGKRPAGAVAFGPAAIPSGQSRQDKRFSTGMLRYSPYGQPFSLRPPIVLLEGY